MSDDVDLEDERSEVGEEAGRRERDEQPLIAARMRPRPVACAASDIPVEAVVGRPSISRAARASQVKTHQACRRARVNILEQHETAPQATVLWLFEPAEG